MLMERQQVSRVVAEGILTSWGCKPSDKVTDGCIGQWWEPPWKIPRFFLQWVDQDYVDSQQLEVIQQGLQLGSPRPN